MKILFSCLIAGLLCGPLFSAERDVCLVKDGKAAVSIVTTGKPSPAERKAASELAFFLDRMTGCGPIPVSAERVPGKSAVVFRRSASKEIQPEGFALEARNDGTVIISAPADIGFLYGAYEILKRYGNVRFLVPGDDGTYVPKRKDFRIPLGKTVCNPSFAVRSGNNLYNSQAGRDWLVRNNMRVVTTGAREDRYAEYAPLRVEGWQCYWRMLSGMYLDTFSRREALAKLDDMFRKHPERFPLIGGRRMPLTDGKGKIVRQFCTSNPDVIRICSDYILRMVGRWTPDASRGFFWLAPNDVTVWCECDACRKLDTPEDRKTHSRGTRAWTFANTVTRQALDRYPGCAIFGMAYQNFQKMPSLVKIDPRLKVFLAFNRRCWRHNIDDPDCPTNRKFRDYYRAWSDAGFDFLAWEQTDHAGAAFLPIEDNVHHTLLFYHGLRCRGSYPECFAPGMRLNPEVFPRRAREAWFGMWQAMYVFAAFQWDLSRDYGKTLEEINSLYYGRGWAGGMRDFRRLLAETSRETPGCFGHGHSSPLGRLLEKPGVHERLLRYLDAAEKAAAADPDPRALAHVKYDRELFADTWEKARREYAASRRELSVLRRTQPVRIDGNLEEADWKNASVVTDFRQTKSGAKAAQQTFVRMLYDDDAFYFGMEAMEPEVGNMRNTVRRHDGEVWNDSTLELFLSSPSMSPRYAQIIVNPSGTVFDQLVHGSGDMSFESGIQCAVRIRADRWTLEARVPAAPLGISGLSDGQIWLMNVMRTRRLHDHPSEASTLSGSSPHDTGTFLPVNLAGKRGTGSSGAEVDRRAFRNGNFSETRKARPKEYGNWTLGPGRLIPRYWSLASAGGALEMRRDSAGDASVLLKKGFIFQMNRLDCDAFAIAGRVRGKGVLNVFLIHYPRKAGTGEVDREARKTVKFPNTVLGSVACEPGAWKDFRFTFRKDPPLSGCISALALSAGPGTEEIEIGNVYMTPVNEK